MIKSSFSTAIIISFLLVACKPSEKEQTPKPQEPTFEATMAYAKFKASVRTDLKLKNWLTTINKTEPVKIIDEIEITKKDSKTETIAKVVLSDNREGYIKRSWLGGVPYAVLENVRVYDKPNKAAQIRATLEPGMIVFFDEETDDGKWIKIWAGQIGKTWITGHWIERSAKIIDTPEVVIDARDYQIALDLIKKDKPELAKKKLKDLEEYSKSVFAQMGTEKLQELENENTKEDTQKNDVPIPETISPDGE